MMQFVPIMIVSFAAALGLTPITRRLARRFGVMDQPSARKVHREATPLLGGLAIYGAMMLALAVFSLDDYLVELLAILAGASWMALIGFLDDRKAMIPWQKFAAQFVAGGVLVLTGVMIRLTGVTLIDAALTIIWVAGITNAVNFQDNMDGLCAGLTAIASGFFFLLAVMEGQGLVASLAAALCGSAIGFLIFNFNPASTFMGDLGSLVLGFTLAVLSIKLRFDSQPFGLSTWSVPLLVLGEPIFDIVLVVFTRLRERRPPWQAGKDHTSHRLVQMGLSMRSAVLVIYGVCVALGIVAIIVSRNPNLAPVLVAVAALAGLAAFVWLERFRILQQRQIEKL